MAKGGSPTGEETGVNRPPTLPLWPESNLPSAAQPGLLIAIVDASNNVWFAISDGSQWNKFTIGKGIGDLAQYEDDGNGNPQLDIAKIHTEGWHIVGASGEPSYQNGWTSYNSDPTAGWGGAAFYKDPFGVVHLRGLVKDGTSDSTIFTLPSGYRPQLDLIVAAIQQGSPETGVRLEVMSNGTVETRNASGSWISLSGVQFTAA